MEFTECKAVLIGRQLNALELKGVGCFTQLENTPVNKYKELSKSFDSIIKNMDVLCTQVANASDLSKRQVTLLTAEIQRLKAEYVTLKAKADLKNTGNTAGFKTSEMAFKTDLIQSITNHNKARKFLKEYCSSLDGSITAPLFDVTEINRRVDTHLMKRYENLLKAIQLVQRFIELSRDLSASETKAFGDRLKTYESDVAARYKAYANRDIQLFKPTGNASEICDKIEREIAEINLLKGEFPDEFFDLIQEALEPYFEALREHVIQSITNVLENNKIDDIERYVEEMRQKEFCEKMKPKEEKSSCTIM